MIEVKALAKSFGKLEVLRGIDLHVPANQVVCLIGPSGSGKSTLLRCLNLLERPTAGTVRIADDEITSPRANVTRIRAEIGMVFQHFNLFPHLSVLSNIVLAPVKVRGETRPAARERALALLDRVGLADKANAYPGQLSGGQKQRVAIARALANDPSLVLADEPTGNLDTRTSVEVMDIFQRLNRERHITVVLITHEHDIAEYGTRVVAFRDGHIVSDQKIEKRRLASDEIKLLPPVTV